MLPQTRKAFRPMFDVTRTLAILASLAPPIVACNKVEPSPTSSSGGGGAGGVAAAKSVDKPPGVIEQPLGAATDCAANAAKLLSLSKRPQFGYQWCWVASAEMLTLAPGAGSGSGGGPAVGIEQCVHASDRFPDKNPRHCCGFPKPENMPSGCDRSGWPRFNAHGYSTSVLGKRWPTWPELKAELDANGALALTQETSSKTAHMLVVTGYAVVNGVRFAEIYDPTDAYSWQIYKSRLDGEDPYHPSRTYLKVRKATVGRAPECKVEDGSGSEACDESWVGAPSPTGVASNTTTVPNNVGAGTLQGQQPPLATFSAPEPTECSTGVAVAIDAARRAIPTLRVLGNAHPVSLNFVDGTQASRAVLDEDTPPFEGVEYLRVGSAQASGVVPGLFEYFYKADGKQLGLLRVMKHTDGNWRAVKFLEDRWARQLVEATRHFAQSPIKPKLVIVPELNLKMLKMTTPQGVRFFPVRAVFGLQPMMPYTAQTLWQTISNQPGFKQLVKSF